MSDFDPILESGDYLSLLHVSSNCAGLIERIGAIARACPDLEAEFRGLLNSGWRPALVACAALFGKCSPPLLEQLWLALDRGSWVAPQMAVTLSLLDPDFSQKARQRLLAGCPPTRSERPITAEVHVLEGPAGVRSMCAKSRVCLMTLLGRDPAGREWLLEHISKADALHDILVEDAWDGSARLVANWAASLASCLDIDIAAPDEEVLTRLWPPETPEWLESGEVSEGFFEPLLRAGATQLEWRSDQRGTLVVAEGVGKVRLNRPYDALLLQHIGRHPSVDSYPTRLGMLRLEPGPPLRFVLQSTMAEPVLLSRDRLEDSGATWLIHGISQDGRLRSGPGADLLGLAGEDLEYELLARLSQQSRQLGEVVQTGPYALQARGVCGILHVIALETPRGCSQPQKLADGLLLALQRCSGKVAIASMGSGGGGLDPNQVARILVASARQANYRGTITFCLPNGRDFQAFERALQVGA